MFNAWKACAYREYNQPEIAEAIFDDNKRKKLLMEGLAADVIKNYEGSSWIFQANPNFYDLDGALAALNKQTWSINQNAYCLSSANVMVDVFKQA